MTRAVIAVVLTLAGVAYPFVTYANLEGGGARWIVLPLAALWLLRALVHPAGQPGGRLLPLLAVAFCALVAFAHDARLALWYPVLINTGMLAVFGGSLLRGVPVIEKMARLRHPDLPPHVVAYTRRVTQVWTAFFAFNGLTSAALALWAPVQWWTLYTGLVSYILIGLLAAGEWLVRPTPPKAA